MRGGSVQLVDLFCGVGGLSAGFEEAGHKAVAALDVDDEAIETYRSNFPNARIFHTPIERLSTAKLLGEIGAKKGDLDLIVGGPPCQAFSVNNHRRSKADYRASLAFHYLRFVAQLAPKHVLLENVPGIQSVEGENIALTIENELRSLGYEASSALLDCSQFGLPQSRKRVFIFASRICDPLSLWEEVFASGKTKGMTKHGLNAWTPKNREVVNIQDAIFDLPEIENGSECGLYRDAGSLSAYQKRARTGTTGLANHRCSRLGKVNLERLHHILPGENWRAIPFNRLPDGMKRARKSDHTKRYGRLKWKGQAGTILTKCDPHWGAYFHPSQDRVISVREAARLQGFVDRFQFTSKSLTSQYRGIGNAVPPLIAAKIANCISCI